MPKVKILVVDDESHLTYILAYKLGQWGAEVLTAPDGEEGLRVAGAHLPDLVITDHQMPGMDGLSLCARLKADARTASIPVVMLTGRGHRVAASALAETNIRCLLPKPFSAHELLEKVAELLGPRAAAAAALVASVAPGAGAIPGAVTP